MADPGTVVEEMKKNKDVYRRFLLSIENKMMEKSLKMYQTLA